MREIVSQGSCVMAIGDAVDEEFFCIVVRSSSEIVPHAEHSGQHPSHFGGR